MQPQQTAAADGSFPSSSSSSPSLPHSRSPFASAAAPLALIPASLDLSTSASVSPLAAGSPPLPAPETTAPSPAAAALGPELLSFLLHPPSPAAIPLSVSAPHLYEKLVRYEQLLHPDHSPKLVSTIADAVAISSPLLPSSPSSPSPLLSRMSHADLLRLHLADLLVLVETLLEALEPAAVLAATAAAAPSLPSPVAFAFAPQPSPAALAIVDRLIAKQRLITATTASLLSHQQRQRRIASLTQEIAELDSAIIAFARSLGGVEQLLHSTLHPADAAAASPSVSSSPSSSSASPLRPLSVADIVRYGEKLSYMSFAPSDITERKGQSMSRPPAPLEAEMAVSLLQMGLDEMQHWMQRRRAEEQQEGGAAAAQQQRRDAPLPSLEEVQKAAMAAGVDVTAMKEQKTQRQPQQQQQPPPPRPRPPPATSAPSLLDLDLNPELDDSDEDDDSDAD